MKKSIITFLCLMLITLSGCTYNTKYSESDAPTIQWLEAMDEEEYLKLK